QGDEENTVRETGKRCLRCFNAEPCLADARWPDQCDQTDIWSQQIIVNVGDFLVTPDQRGDRGGQIGTCPFRRSAPGRIVLRVSNRGTQLAARKPEESLVLACRHAEYFGQPFNDLRGGTALFFLELLNCGRRTADALCQCVTS